MKNRGSGGFNALVERAVEGGEVEHLRRVIGKELLHYDILYALDRAGLLNGLVFQGGTCLRLCYGAPRYSEDLDFAAGRDFKVSDLAGLKGAVEGYVGARHGLEVRVKEPAVIRTGAPEGNAIVARWWVGVVTDPAHRDVPMERIKIEVARVPAHTRELRRVNLNYGFLPDGYGDLLIVTESLDEIMADKLVALVASQEYVRYRDIWDLPWLKQQGATVRPDLVRRKIVEYGEVGYAERVDSFVEEAASVIAGEACHDQMRRFLSRDQYEGSLGRPGFEGFLTGAIRDLYGELRQGLDVLSAAESRHKAEDKGLSR